MWSYLHKQRSKQTNLVDLQFFLNYALFSKNWCGKLEPPIWKYIIEFHWTIGWLDIQRISKSIYYFQERLSLRYSIIVKLLPLFHVSINWMMFPETTKLKSLEELSYVCIISMVGSCKWEVFLKNRCSNFWKYKEIYRGGSSPSDWVRQVSCLVQILGEKNLNLKQPSGGSLKTFVIALILIFQFASQKSAVFFFTDVCKEFRDICEEEHCRLLDSSLKY